ncbi:MAG: glycosyltransferase family 2 protein [Calditrichaeota bacterium]|nr:glycosyltransferase family 2 protein [Calditrichota bacterium]MCB9088590.1 glycosyltransferase family 2 protein [Calditrichia bacterium]MCB0288642.1 glycosyltransferase family 2 protein [Calditrichota bacterium]MCB0294129.1 glycosyltransferase family 2 protein [Calditrichota bacterium]MCB0302434.1 glycosyltransferase family 2 protein [Calditrichota bacterium]
MNVQPTPSLPLVSCIMPTRNRRVFVEQAIRYFLRQDYPHKELLIIDDGSDTVQDLAAQDAVLRYIRLEKRHSVGAKRNLAVEAANGEIILHWDDDDWHAPGRIRLQVEALLRQDGEICGCRRLLNYHPRSRRFWLYEYPLNRRKWMAGGTFCYHKSFWRRHLFPDVNVGEDTRFVWQQPLDKAIFLPDYRFYLAIVHSGNTSRKSLAPPYWQRWREMTLEELVGEDWQFYEALSDQGAVVRDQLSVVSCRKTVTKKTKVTT